MKTKQIGFIIIGTIFRYILLRTNFLNIFTNRVEISTPLNSFKRLKEGIYLYENEINPYHGDMFHETPMILIASSWLHKNSLNYLPLIYIILDILTAILMYKTATNFCKQKIESEKLQKKEFAANTEEMQYNNFDLYQIPHYILLTFLFNPFLLMNCAGLTSTVFSNFFISLYFYFLSKNNMILCLLFLALETTRNFYPFVLIAPIILTFGRKSFIMSTSIVFIFGILFSILSWINYTIMGNWSFLNGSIGFILCYGDLQPNVGLFWYFFTEMFEHFRTMFLVTFQMNATVLYLIPLSLRLRKDPIMLGVILCAITAIFKSYPCFGDIGLYISMLPFWTKSWKFMAHNFVVFCFFIITMLILPSLWHLWIYFGSANSNFYFGATLAFCTGQIFLVTDLLFAYVKKEFCLRNGERLIIDDKEAKIVLQ